MFDSLVSDKMSELERIRPENNGKQGPTNLTSALE